MPRKDAALLLDMLLAARKIQRYSSGLTRKTLLEHEMASSAIIREFQVMGEAARIISDPFKGEHDNIPWKVIAGLRNRVIHEYFRVDLDLLWQTIADDLPPLIAQLEAIVSAFDEDDMETE